MNPDEIIQYLTERIPPRESMIDMIPESVNGKLMLEWPIYDAHHGMLAWAKETGADYDSKISRHLQISAGNLIFQSYGYVEQTTILFGGDNQTADNRQSKTEKSANCVDTDTRYARMTWTCLEAAIASIETAAKFSKHVLVIVLSGNHDWHSAIHLTQALWAYFRNCPNITIDVSPEKHRFYIWGKTAFMATHGDVNSGRIAPFALQQILRRGLARDHDIQQVMVRMGHLHKRERTTPKWLDEEDGVIIERFPTLAAQEAYSIEGAWTMVRATSVQLWHKDRTVKYGGREIGLGEILERYPYSEC